MSNLFYTYAIYSEAFDKIYIGYSSDVEKRVQNHNSKINRGWTSKYQPWKLVYTEKFNTKKEAMTREKQLKSANGREFIRKLINSDDI